MKILLIGDSITEGFKTDLLLPRLKILNKGISGDNSEGVFNRLKHDVIAQAPDIVYILIGTNDFALGRSNDQLLETLENTAEILQTYLKKTKIYFTSILPTLDIEDRPNERINEMNLLISKLCERKGLEYFNLHYEMADEFGNLKEELTIDGLHLSNTAYKIWSQILLRRHS
jgi:lysophospholipase L1-like esterase